MYRLTASFKSCCSVVGALESVTPSLGAGVVFVVRYQKPLSSVTARKEGVCGIKREGDGLNKIQLPGLRLCFPLLERRGPHAGVLYLFRDPFCWVSG